jgi:hypothetical protein
MRFELESLTQLFLIAFFGYILISRLSIPSSFYVVLSIWLFLLTVIGGGWPFSIPYGRPFRKLWLSGVFMTLLLLMVSGISYIFIGILGLQHLLTTWFWLCANWALIFEAWPMRHYKPRTALLTGLASTSIAAYAVGLLFDQVSVRHYLPIFMQAQLAVAVIFSPFFVFQGYPFYRLSRQPRIGLAIMAASTAAGLGITVVFKDIHTYISSITSAVLLWSILYSWAFAYPFSRKYGQPRRGLVTLPIIILISFVWSNLFSMFLSVPEVVWLNLYLLLPAFIIHNMFWFRMPFSPPLLLGMPPQQQKSLEKLFDWFLQVRD